MGKRKELQADISELEKFLRETTRPFVKDTLTSALETSQKQLASVPVVAEPKPKLAPREGTYISVKKFSWDQEGKKLSVYVLSLPGTKNLEKSNIELRHNENMIDLKLHNLEGNNYHLRFNNLFAAIASVSFRARSSGFGLAIRKKEDSFWDSIEKKANPKPLVNEQAAESDPSGNMLNIYKVENEQD